MARNSRKNSTPRKRTKRAEYRTFYMGAKQFRVSRKILAVIKRLQSSSDLCIPRMCFSRVVREILQDLSNNREDYRIQSSALKALHEAAESYIVGIYSQCNLLAGHAKRVTVMPADFRLCLIFRESATLFS